MLKKIFLFLFSSSLLLANTARAAADLSYDKYAPVLAAEESRGSTAKRALAHFPVYPFEVVRYPIDKGLVEFEKRHIDKKIQWMYERLDDYGISPKLGLLNPTSVKLGSDFDISRMIGYKAKHPNSVLNSWVHWAGLDLFRAGGEAGWERIGETGFEAKTFLNYEDRHREHFYGIGPDTSKGDGAVYEREETLVQGVLGYSFDFVHEMNLNAGYKNVNISGGKDGGRGQFGQTRVFNEVVTPGMPGSSLFILGTAFNRDSRNQKENSTSGGHQRFAVNFHEGLNASDARFFKFAVEGSQYLRLKSDRRVLVFHGFAEHNNALDSKVVPFHEMARLGGHGTDPDLSHTLRSYDRNRFTDSSAALVNVEYRYTVWEYKDWKADTIFFWDAGQTFDKFGQFQMKDFRQSYGLGVRFSIANIVLLTTELAHGNEGTELYVRSSAPF